MADNQHFQYINKLPYFKEIYGKSKLWLKAYSYPRIGHWTWGTKMRYPGLFISVVGSSSQQDTRTLFIFVQINLRST